jgi:hypothetical protein
MKKDERTERLRRAIAESAHAAIEDQRAEAGLTILSLHSVYRHERHVWIDTDLAGELVIDLEDWNCQEAWDNSVAHLKASDEDVPGIVQAWLTGATVEECLHLGGHQIPGLK